MVVVGFWKTLGVYFFFIQVIFVFRALPPCSRFAVRFLLKKTSYDFENFYNPHFPKTVSAVLTA